MGHLDFAITRLRDGHSYCRGCGKCYDLHRCSPVRWFHSSQWNPGWKLKSTPRDSPCRRNIFTLTRVLHEGKIRSDYLKLGNPGNTKGICTLTWWPYRIIPFTPTAWFPSLWDQYAWMRLHFPGNGFSPDGDSFSEWTLGVTSNNVWNLNEVDFEPYTRDLVHWYMVVTLECDCNNNDWVVFGPSLGLGLIHGFQETLRRREISCIRNEWS